MHDRFNGQHAIADTRAVSAFERAVAALAAHRPAAAAALDEALALEPEFVAAHALKGFACLSLARAELLGPATDAAALARKALRRAQRPSGSEATLVAALDLAVAGRFQDAAARLERRLAHEPLNFLLLKLAHGLRFMAGDGPGMLAATSSVAGAWGPGDPAAGYVFGCHAFALEEAGHYAAAERFGETAVALAPDDAWGLHALSHVDEMNRRIAIGIDRLERSRAVWAHCNNFQFHMAWHLALLHLASGNADAALRLYDEEIRPQPTDDFRDVANAASLLWRLRLAGIAVGDRWAALAELAKRRAAETTLVFASLHHMLALAATGDVAGLDAALVAWERYAATGRGDQARVAASVGLDMARVIAGRPTSQGLVQLARQLPCIGGSVAQRDVFMQTLAGAAGDPAARDAIAALRHGALIDERVARPVGHLEAA